MAGKRDARTPCSLIQQGRFALCTATPTDTGTDALYHISILIRLGSRMQRYLSYHITILSEYSESGKENDHLR